MRSTRFLWATCLAVLLAAVCVWPIHAAYTTATIIANEAQADGRVRLLVRFTGNAGETPRDIATFIDGNTTGLILRQWAIGQAQALNSIKTLSNAASLQVGQVVDLTTITPPALTAEQQWQQAAAKYIRIRVLVDAGLVSTADAQVYLDDAIAKYSNVFLQTY